MNFNFDSIKTWLINKYSTITNNVKKLFRLSEYAEFLSLISYAIELFTIYVEIRVRESSWRYAQKRSSLIRQCFELGYIPHRKIGAIDNIYISCDPTFESTSNVTYLEGNVNFPKWFTVSDTTGGNTLFLTQGGSYLNGTIAVTKSLTSGNPAINLGNGLVSIPCINSFYIGQQIYITGTSSYDGAWVVANGSSGTEIYIESDYIPEVFTVNSKARSGLLVLPIKEGIPKTYTYIANGNNFESFRILESDIDNEILDIYIVDSDGNILDTVTILDRPERLKFEDDMTQYLCSVENSINFDYIKITFGDGVKTKKLNNGDRVLVKFAKTKGNLGNISDTNVITAFAQAVRDLNGNTVSSLYCTNFNSVEGGTDYQDIEDIRYYAPKNYNTNDNVTQGERWEPVLEEHPLILKARVWTDYDIGIYNTYNTIIHLALVGRNGKQLSLEQQETIALFLKNKKCLSEIPKFEQLKLLNSRFYIDGGVLNQSIESLEDEISTILLNNYDIEFRQFNQDIYNSQASALLRSEVLPNLIYYTFEIKHCEKSENLPEITHNVSAYEVLVSLPSSEEPDTEHQVYITSGSVEIWLKRKIAGVIQDEIRVGKCNVGDPTLIEGDNGYTITNGLVNYVGNIVTFLIQDIQDDSPGFATYGSINPTELNDLGYWVRLVYKTENGEGGFTSDIRLPDQFIITDCDDDDIVSILHYEG